LRYDTKEEESEGETVIDMKVDIDLNRNESLIYSLDRKGLLSKIDI
jgi:hypothetical protein